MQCTANELTTTTATRKDYCRSLTFAELTNNNKKKKREKKKKATDASESDDRAK